MGGLDADHYEHVVWVERLLSKGDRVSVKVVGVDEVFPYSEKRLSDRRALKQEYDRLKKELEDNGYL